MIGSARFARSSLVVAALVAVALPAEAQTPRPYSLTLYDQLDYRGASVTFYGDNASIGSTGFAERARSAQVRGTWRVCEGGGYRNRCEILDANVRDLAALDLAGRVGSAQLIVGSAPPQAAPAYPPPSSGYPPPPYARSTAAGAEAPRPYLRPENPPEHRGRPEDPRLADLPPAADAPDRYARPRLAPPPAAQSGASALDVPAPAPAADRNEGRTVVFIARPTLQGQAVAAGDIGDADLLCAALGFGRAAYFDDDARAPRSVDVRGRAVGDGPVLRDLLCRRY